MAEKKLEKGSAEWQFFQDFWKFRQQYHEPDNEPDDWYTELVHSGDDLIRKYENTDFEKFAKEVVFAHYADIELRRKKGNTR